MSPSSLYQGSLPKDQFPLLETIADRFLELVPKKKLGAQSHHIWYQQAPEDIQNMMRQVRDSGFFQKLLCTGKPQCSVRSIADMDELYYSHPPAQTDGNIYGDSGLFNPHIDGAFPFLPGMNVYRFIVALTPNQTVFTIFPRQRAAAALNKGDYMGFNFNKELHFVAGQTKPGEHRILLKLHFAVCTICSKADESRYLKWTDDIHSYYEKITRGAMSYGAKPQNISEYTMGYFTQMVTWLRVWWLWTLTIGLMIYGAYRYGLRKRNRISRRR